MVRAFKERARRRPSPAERRVGYVVAVLAQAVMLYIANNLLEWEWPSFLTDDFESVLPWLNLSLIVGIVVNAAYIPFDPRWFRSVGQLIENVFSVVVIVRFLQVFPFDFAAWDTDWSWLVRMVLVVALIGVVIGSIVELGRLMRASLSGGADVDTAPR